MNLLIYNQFISFLQTLESGEIRCWSWNPGLDCCEFNLFFLGTRITYRRIVATCASFAVFHFCPGFLFEAKNVFFLVSFFPLLLLTHRQQEWKFPSE